MVRLDLCRYLCNLSPMIKIKERVIYSKSPPGSYRFRTVLLVAAALGGLAGGAMALREKGISLSDIIKGRFYEDPLTTPGEPGPFDI